MTNKPDTSREAVEALAKTNREKFVMMGPRYLMMRIEEMADVLRALLDERDALKAERDAARRAALEEAAKICDRRAKYAFSNCDYRSGSGECINTANGRDCLCQQVMEDAENMAHSIRHLRTT